MIRMHGDKDYKLGDSFTDKDTKVYYFDGLNWVLPLVFTYRNWSNKTSERTVIPVSTFYGITEYHKDKPQWFLHCFDIEKKAYRDFALDFIIKFL